MKPYILLTSGPLTTSQTVKEAMLTDWCTWDEDYNLHIVEEIRKSLVSLATQHTGDYTSILLQGSGTYCVEAVIGSVIKPGDKLLILSNGAYGDRMGNIAEYHGISYDMLAFVETEQVSVSYVDDYLSHNAEITHVAVVHCETTTGVLNPLKEIAHLVKMHGKKLIVDAMSSFGGVPLDVHELGIDFLISSANKCIQGVPGFGFIIARRSELLHCKGVSKSLSLDIYDQWEAMEKGHGKWRFTSPTHVVRAFKQAMDELAEEGGVEARHNRYCENHRVLVDGSDAELTQSEFRIVALLAQYAGMVITYDEMMVRLWGPNSTGGNQILRVNMTNIRRKLERDPAHPRYIFTENGVGYRMALPEEV